MKKYFIFFLVTLSFSKGAFAGSPRLKNLRATNERSDTIDILNYTIHFDLSNMAAQQISSRCDILFVSKMNTVGVLHLDLLQLQIDSVISVSGQPLVYNYDSLLLKINLDTVLNTGDTFSVHVFYHGHPQADASWGGFYFQPPYAYQMGVAFTSIPHNFGRTWFPCFDNFVERSTYEFYITVPSGKTATCNGLLLDTANSGFTTTWHWKLSQTIPSYLACVTVSDYAIVKSIYNGLLGPIPVWLAALPSDTLDLKNSFINLDSALSIFENHFGPYRWDKVGYSVVPFSGGAMEHATDISYPLLGVTGSTAYETTMAHELSHHWFGDLVTCSTAADMWMNEGWAAYCENLFLEKMYGKDAYQTEVNSNHVISCLNAAIHDGGYFPLSGMPEFTTYGYTTYQKGADIVHTLRSYMGDSLFFHCVANYLNDNQFTDRNSSQLRDYLQTCSGINLHPFFDDWVFSPGLAQFSIDSFTTADAGSGWYWVNVFIKQKLDHAPHYYQNVPMEITFMNNNWESVKEEVLLSGPCTIYKTKIPMMPDFVGLDLSQKISDAVCDEAHVISQTGFNNFVYPKMNLNVSSITDSAFVRIENNYVAPDPFKMPHPGYHLSIEHYWNVDGIFPPGFNAEATVRYNGTTPAQISYSSEAYLDDQLITNVEDSLVMFYRAKVSDDWSLVPNIVFNFQGSHSNKSGLITINFLKKGQYALGIKQWNKIDSILPTAPDSCVVIENSFESINGPNSNIHVYPNPAGDSFFVEGKFSANSLLEIYDSNGKPVDRKILYTLSGKLEINTTGWPNGIYFIRISEVNGAYNLQKIIVLK